MQLHWMLIKYLFQERPIYLLSDYAPNLLEA